MQQLAYEDAIAWYELALADLDAADETDDAERGDLLTRLARAANRAGDGSLWRASSRRATTLTRASGDPHLQARVALDLLGTLGPGFDGSVTDALTEAIDALRLAPPSRHGDLLLAELLCRLSGYVLIEPTRSANLADEALAIARRAADPRVLALALVHSTAGYGLDEAELDRRLRLAADLARTVDDADLILSVTSAQATAALMWAHRDEFDGALAHYKEVAAPTAHRSIWR